MVEVTRWGQENLAGDGGREGECGRQWRGSGEGRGRGVGAAREEHDRAGLVVMGVRRVVEVFVQRGARGEDGERQHKHGSTDRDEAVEEGGERMAARHEKTLESVGT